MSNLNKLLTVFTFTFMAFVISCGDNKDDTNPVEKGETQQESVERTDVEDSHVEQTDNQEETQQDQTNPDLGGNFLLTTNVVGEGSISRNPNSASYPNGTTVQLTAVAPSGWEFSGWSGNGGTLGNQNPVSVTIDSEMIITANFVEATQTDPIEETGEIVEETEPEETFDPTTSRLDNITRTCDPSQMPSDVTSNNNAWGSRYWDCCKPHCSWPENTNNLSRNCNANDDEIPCYTDRGTWQEGTRSGCDSDGEAYTCYSHAPFAVCENLAYGFAAVPAAGDVCGKCYKIQFDGGFEHGNPQEAHRAIQGKTMIVMASNIGHDVAGGQFDIMIPGGGLGAFDAGCAVQWGVDSGNESLVGKRYGGFTSTCEDNLAATRGWGNFGMDDMKQCVRGMCDNLFGDDPNLRDLWEGCIWYVDWMHAANNPTFKYEEVECPQALRDLYGSSFH